MTKTMQNDEKRGKREEGKLLRASSNLPPIPLLSSILLVIFFASTAYAKDFYTKDTKEEPVKAPVQVAKTVVEGEPEGLKKLKAIENQEQWVAKLEKQLAAETAQLKEMQTSLAQNFGLDIKKVEKGEYQFDAKSGKFVEK